jgi:NTE family protein
MTAPDARPRVAIACQGGGSHTAFTAGVLGRLFTDEVLSRYRIVGLSGTSGGAICALLAWTALVRGEPTAAGRLLRRFWDDNAASSPAERVLNAWTLWAAELANFVATPAVSPYDSPVSDLAVAQLKGMLTTSVDFGALSALVDDDDRPRLFLGAVDVMSGDFKAFDSARGEITPEAVVASAAIPNLFRSVHEAGGVYWDGLFSQNPPVRELLDTAPDEIWVIQINAKKSDAEPRTTVEIADRRNELSGNLSLYQELHFIETIDSLLEDGSLAPGRYKPITIRIIQMNRSARSHAMGAASKINRDPRFLDELIGQGERRTTDFLTALAFERAWVVGDADAIAGFFTEDTVVGSAAPFAVRPPRRGAAAAREFVDALLAAKVGVDLTRKQQAADHVRWRVRKPAGDDGVRVTGTAELRFENGVVTAFSLGPVV